MSREDRNAILGASEGELDRLASGCESDAWDSSQVGAVMVGAPTIGMPAGVGVGVPAGSAGSGDSDGSPDSDERQVAGELVAFIRENKDEIVSSYIQAYDRVYLHSRGAELPQDMRLDWIHSLIEAQICELEGTIDPDRYLTCGGDMVVQFERSLNPIMTYMESKLFFARFLAPCIWRRFASEPAKVARMLRAVERSVQVAIRANTESFLTRLEQPGQLSGTWDRFVVPTEFGMAGERRDAATARVQDQPAPSQGHPELTPREEQIAQLIVSGSTNKEIASRLGIGLSTVKNGVGRIFDKLGVQSRTELVALMLKRDA